MCFYCVELAYGLRTGKTSTVNLAAKLDVMKAKAEIPTLPAPKEPAAATNFLAKAKDLSAIDLKNILSAVKKVVQDKPNAGASTR